jgi:uncharacterized protein YbjQ (UPF0145 family)
MRDKGPVLNFRITGNSAMLIWGLSQMKITTMETIAGRSTEETLGVVRGSALWSKRITKYSYGGQRTLQYSSMDDMAEGLNVAREEAEKKAQAQAKFLGADAIIGMRLEVFEMSEGMFTAVATGTAVRTEPLPAAMPAFEQASNDDEFSTIPFIPKPALRVVGGYLH